VLLTLQLLCATVNDGTRYTGRAAEPKKYTGLLHTTASLAVGTALFWAAASVSKMLKRKYCLA
jgi:hypothetical protein